MDRERGAEAVAALQAEGLQVELDRVLEPELLPDDPAWGEQRATWDPTGVSRAWDLTTGREDVTVAILDTGNVAHPDLPGLDFARGYDVTDGDADATDPGHGHGTIVAGWAGARGDNGRGMAGVCSNCTLLPVRVMGTDGLAWNSAVAGGVVRAADAGADIINLSLGGTSHSDVTADAIRYARQRGAIVVAAAGNDGAGERRYPAAYDGVVSVAAVEADDRLADWSTHGQWVDLAAPGCGPSTDIGGGIRRACGTSLAAPFVAGTLALQRSVAPDASWDELLADLESTTEPVRGGSRTIGGGRVDVDAAVRATSQRRPQLGESADEAIRYQGDDRYATAARLAAQRGRADVVVLARGDDYPDALTAGPLAAQLDAPVLLSPRSGLRPEVAAVIADLGASKAVLLGSRDALGEGVERDLTGLGLTIERIAGTDRFARNADVARRIWSRRPPRRAYLVEGIHADPLRGWPDAVAISALAAHERHPILLTARDALPAATHRLLERSGVEEVVVIGGPPAVSEQVLRTVEDLGIRVRRWAGPDRLATSAAVARHSVTAGMDGTQLWVSTARNWPDALAAGPAVAAGGGVLLLTEPGAVRPSSATAEWLQRHSDRVQRLHVVGGPPAITHRGAGDVARLIGLTFE